MHFVNNADHFLNARLHEMKSPMEFNGISTEKRTTSSPDLDLKIFKTYFSKIAVPFDCVPLEV